MIRSRVREADMVGLSARQARGLTGRYRGGLRRYSGTNYTTIDTEHGLFNILMTYE